MTGIVYNTIILTEINNKFKFATGGALLCNTQDKNENIIIYLEDLNVLL